MVERYTAVCCQANDTAISHRSEIKEANLERALGLIDYAALVIGFPDFAPTRLVVFHEVFMQGWPGNTAPYSTIYEKIAKDVAIQIPGDETDLLAEKAKTYNLYIAGTAFEVIPEISSDFPFNCAFIIDPRGEVIFKYHKLNPYLVRYGREVASPHDVFDRYMEVMDGKYGRKKGDIVSCFFPVVESDIGKLGYIICNDGFYMESSRVLALQGCEVMLRSSGDIEPEGGPPMEQWEIGNRAHAQFNLMYVVACASGYHFAPGFPLQLSRGHSMIIDYHGALLCHADYGGETVTFAVIDIESLRKRRTDRRINWITQLRTEVYRKMYEKPIYPKNLFLERPLTSLAGTERMDAQPVERFIKEGIWISPSV